MKVKQVNYNWFAVSEVNGEEFSVACIDSNGVDKIEYHEPAGHGDQHYCDIYSGNGEKRRVFNISAVFIFEVPQ